METHPTASPALAVVTVRSEVVRTIVPVWLWEVPRALMGSPSALVEVRAMRAVLPARLRLLQRLVVLECIRRGMPKQLGNEIELV